jgi:DNA-binding NarL/FixJ family response regulator
MKKIKLVIADDHAVFRNALRVLLSQESDFEVVAEASNEAEAVEAVSENDTDVLLLDMSMPPGMAGPRVAKAALRQNPELTIVVLTMHDDQYYVKDMFRLGAKAYVLKKSSEAELFQAIRSAHDGIPYIDSVLVNEAVSSFTGVPIAPREDPELNLLTAREQEVCRLLAYGHTNGEIAELLSISERTVQTHRRNLMEKLGLHGRAELVTFALNQGLLTPPA